MPTQQEATVAHYTGHVTIGGERVQIDFTAPADATTAQLDAAAFASLASVAEVNYLQLGTEGQDSEAADTAEEDAIDAYLTDQMVSGNMSLIDMPTRMTRYGLMDPGDFRAEMRERMNPQG